MDKQMRFSLLMVFVLLAVYTLFNGMFLDENIGGDAKRFVEEKNIEEKTIQLSYHPSRLIITFKDDVDLRWLPENTEKIIPKKEKLSREVSILSDKYSFESIKRIAKLSDNFPGLRKTVVVETNDLESTKKALMSEPTITSVNYDYNTELHYNFPLYPPNDPLFDDSWHLANYFGSNIVFQPRYGEIPLLLSEPGYPDADIDFHDNLYLGDEGVLVAVIDTGIHYEHPDLVNQLWVNEDEIPDNGVDDDNNGYIDDYNGYNFLQENSNIYDTYVPYGHGTHVSGIIASEENELGIIGVCPDCEIMVLKAIPGWVSAGIEAIVYAVDNDAKVLSNSWGVPTKYWDLDVAVANAYDAGRLVVFSAANANVCISGCSDSVYFSPVSMSNEEKIIVVAATDNKDEKASFSNYGSTVDLSAPGTNILSTAKNCQHKINQEPEIADYYYCESVSWEPQYITLSGTSMAAPIVSGIAGAIWGENPDWTNEDITNELKESVDNIYIRQPEWEGFLGTGRINAGYIFSPPTNRDKIAIISIGVDNLDVGEEATFEIEVLNYGTDDQENLYLNFYVEGEPSLQTQTIDELPSGESIYLYFDWNVPFDCDYYTTVAFVDSSLLEERYKADNHLRKEFLVLDPDICDSDAFVPSSQ